MKIQIRECTDSGCHFRFPQPVSENMVEKCPLCKGQAKVVVEYLAGVEQFPAQQPSNQQPSNQQPSNQQPATQQLSVDNQQFVVDNEQSTALIPNSDGLFDCHVLLDNLRSLQNVGTIFRTADGVGISHMHLGGTTPTPAHPRFAKTALGAERTVPWQYHTNGLQAALALKERGRYLIGLEYGLASRSLFEARPMLDFDRPLLVVVGNEVGGIDPEILDACDEVVHLPMVGIKTSLNVAVAFGIGVYQLRYGKSVNKRSAAP